MTLRARIALPALLVAATIPAIAFAQQAQTEPPGQPQTRSERRAERPKLSPQARAALQDGRFAMIREALKLNDAQRKLWEPVEAQMRAAAADRQNRREERRAGAAAEPSLPDRLDRASERMAKRAADMKAFAEVFKPFYASLSEEQKAVAGIVVRRGHFGGHRYGHRWAMQR